jgi:hypothetical protein
VFSDHRVRGKLIKLDAPKGFQFHLFRHAIASWLENEGLTADCV